MPSVRTMQVLSLCLLEWITLVHMAQADAIDGCSYTYIEQPPLDLYCNPYLVKELCLRCTVKAAKGDFKIQWVWVPIFEYKRNMMQETSTKSARESSGSVTVSSMLQLPGLNDSHLGTYWCQVVLNDTQALVKSSVFFLIISSYYVSIELPACAKDTPIVQNGSKCADMRHVTPNLRDSRTQLLTTPSPSHSQNIPFAKTTTVFVTTTTTTTTPHKRPTISLPRLPVTTTNYQGTPQQTGYITVPPPTSTPVIVLNGTIGLPLVGSVEPQCDSCADLHRVKLLLFTLLAIVVVAVVLVVICVIFAYVLRDKKRLL